MYQPPHITQQTNRQDRQSNTLDPEESLDVVAVRAVTYNALSSPSDKAQHTSSLLRTHGEAAE
eukprot:3876355-Amphidinium_carterae.1